MYNDFAPADLPHAVAQNGVKTISAGHLVVAMYGPNYSDHPDWDQQIADFKEWSAKYNVGYYGRPREDFWVHEALEIAETEGREFMVLEDLS